MANKTKTSKNKTLVSIECGCSFERRFEFMRDNCVTFEKSLYSSGYWATANDQFHGKVSEHGATHAAALDALARRMRQLEKEIERR